ADDDAPAIMPYAEEQVVENNARFDLWMLLFPTNAAKGTAEEAEMTGPTRAFDCPGCPAGLSAVPSPAPMPFDEDCLFGKIMIQVQETQTSSLLFGVGVNSDAGMCGSITINERNYDAQCPAGARCDPPGSAAKWVDAEGRERIGVDFGTGEGLRILRPKS